MSVAGAVKRPLGLTVPVPAGSIDQLTAVLVVLVTRAVNCSVPPAGSVDEPGETVMATGGMSVIEAVRGVEPVPSVLAVIVTFCCVLIVAGEVYRPEGLSVPGLPDGMDHVAPPALQEPVSRTVNCWLWD